MFSVLGCQNSNVLIYLTGNKRATKNPMLASRYCFALEYKASLNFQHLSDAEAESLEC